MFCTKCGAQIPDNSKFCGKCGQSVVKPNGIGVPHTPTVPARTAGNKPQSQLQVVKEKGSWITWIGLFIVAVVIAFIVGIKSSDAELGFGVFVFSAIIIAIMFIRSKIHSGISTLGMKAIYRGANKNAKNMMLYSKEYLLNSNSQTVLSALYNYIRPVNDIAMLPKHFLKPGIYLYQVLDQQTIKYIYACQDGIKHGTIGFMAILQHFESSGSIIVKLSFTETILMNGVAVNAKEMTVFAEKVEAALRSVDPSLSVTYAQD